MSKRNQNTFNVLFFLFCLLLIGCSKKELFYHNEQEIAPDEAGVYTELHLKKDKTFIEYLYYSIGDTLTEVDFGNAIVGTYHWKEDSLFLLYNGMKGDTLNSGMGYNEAYVLRNGQLTKLQPVTYSSHFVNLVLSPGKASQLRSRTNYYEIIWKLNGSDETLLNPNLK